MNAGGLAACADGTGPLVAALAASVALHAALLAGLPDIWTYSERPATAPLNARLVAGAPPAAVKELPAAAPSESESPQSKPQAPARKSRALAPAPAPASPAAAAPPAPAAAAPVEHAAPAPSPAAEPAPVAPAGTPAARAGAGGEPALALGVPTLAPRPGDDAAEAGSLAQYRLALIGAAKRLKHYPAQAIDRGLEGRVDVRLVVGADGAPAAVSVKRSSGHEVLDRQAVDTIRRAIAATPIPPALRDREIVVEIPLLYELKSAS
jgi:protein TonB